MQLESLRELRYNSLYLAGIYGSRHMEDGVNNMAEVFNQLRNCAGRYRMETGLKKQKSKSCMNCGYDQ